MLELLCWNAAITQSLSTAFVAAGVVTAGVVAAGVGTAETEGVIGGLKRFRVLNVFSGSVRAGAGAVSASQIGLA